MTRSDADANVHSDAYPGDVLPTGTPHVFTQRDFIEELGLPGLPDVTEPLQTPVAPLTMNMDAPLASIGH